VSASSAAAPSLKDANVRHRTSEAAFGEPQTGQECCEHVRWENKCVKESVRKREKDSEKKRTKAKSVKDSKSIGSLCVVPLLASLTVAAGCTVRMGTRGCLSPVRRGALQTRPCRRRWPRRAQACDAAALLSEKPFACSDC
jgi:hypothetical protein